MTKVQIQPSLLAADKARLGEEARRAESAGADALHLDIMDGHFVHNLSFGPDVVAMARKQVRMPLSVHLMVSRPDRYAEPYAQAGAGVLLIHIEAPCDVRRTLRAIRGMGVEPGITLNPETPDELIADLLDARLVDEVLCMTVHPGFGGQAFLPEVLPKIASVRRRAPWVRISVDGGIGEETAARCAAAGADVFIAGTTLYGAEDMAASIRAMRERAQAELDAGRAAP